MTARGGRITVKEGEGAPRHVGLAKQPMFVAQVNWDQDLDVHRAAAKDFKLGQPVRQSIMIVQGQRGGQPAGCFADSREVSKAHSPPPHDGRLKCSEVHRGEWKAVREGPEAHLEGAAAKEPVLRES